MNAVEQIRVDAVIVEDRARVDYNAWRERESFIIAGEVQRESGLNYADLGRELTPSEAARLAGLVEDALRRSGMYGAVNEPTALYRYFDCDGSLLYVGITNNLDQRDRQHSKEKPWHKTAASRTAQWFDDRVNAAAAEMAAIRAEGPKFNIVGAQS